MEKQISSGLKTLLLVDVIVCGIYGLVALLVPESMRLLGDPVKDPFSFRVIGAATLAFTSGSWFAYRAGIWEKVKIAIQMIIIWAVLGALVFLWGLFFAGLPPIHWMTFAIMAGFGAAFSYFYFKV